MIGKGALAHNHFFLLQYRNAVCIAFAFSQYFSVSKFVRVGDGTDSQFIPHRPISFATDRKLQALLRKPFGASLCRYRFNIHCSQLIFSDADRKSPALLRKPFLHLGVLIPVSI